MLVSMNALKKINILQGSGFGVKTMVDVINLRWTGLAFRTNSDMNIPIDTLIYHDIPIYSTYQATNARKNDIMKDLAYLRMVKCLLPTAYCLVLVSILDAFIQALVY